MTDSKQKILLIDANNMLFRAFCANPALSSKGHHVGGILGFFYSLQKGIKDVNPHRIFVIWDGRGGAKRRREVVPDYKEGRKAPKPLSLNRTHDIQATPEEEKQSLYYQQGRVIELLNNFPFIQLCENGVEADDFISYLCNKYSISDKYMKVIISNDKDFIQLTNESTILYRPITDEYITHKSFLEKEGVHPNNMALARSVEGDPGDNLPGVKGVGRKTLIKIFPELSTDKFVTVDEFLQFCTDRDTRASKLILADKTIVSRNYEVMQLYSPLVPVQTSIKIDQQIEDYSPDVSVSSFYDSILQEGIEKASFYHLTNQAYKILKDYTNERSISS